MRIILLDPKADWLAEEASQLFPHFEIVATYTDMEEGRQALHQSADIALISLDMPRADGLEIARSLIHADCEVIVSSEWATFAYEAVRLGAIDYLLTPFDSDELRSAFERAAARVEEKRLIKKKLSKQTLFFQKGFGLLDAPNPDRLPLEMIVRCLKTPNGTQFELKNNFFFVLEHPFDNLVQQLTKHYFVQTSDICLVNLLHVKRFQWDTYTFILEDGKRIRVPKVRVNDVQSKLQAQYWAN